MGTQIIFLCSTLVLRRKTSFFDLKLSKGLYLRKKVSNFFCFFQTAAELKTDYEDRLKKLNFTYNMYAAFTYDAAWSIALMLNKSIPLLREKNKTLETLKYGDKEAAEIMRDLLFRTDFWGMSVRTLSPAIALFHKLCC